MELLLLGLLAAGAVPPPFPGNDHSYGISASRDLRYVAFASNASNLVPGDTNGQPDVFVADRQTGTIVRASVDADGIQGNGQSAWPSLSADGRYVAFDTAATNLGPQGAGLVRKDLVTGALAQGAVRGGYSPSYPSISDDGRYAASDPGGVIQSHDFETGSTTSVTSGGFFDDAHPVVSGDGRWVFFASNRANLVAGDTNGVSDLFRWDRTDPSAGFERVSLGAGGVEGNGASPPFFPTTRPTRSPRPYAVTPSGSHILFASNATNLVAGESTGGLVGRNIDTGAMIRVASCTSCNAFGGAFDAVELSSDARFGGFLAGSSFQDASGERAPGYYRVDTTTLALTPIGERGPEAVVFDSPYSMAVSDDGASYALQSTLIEPGVDDRARYADVLAGATGAPARTILSRGAIGRAGDGHSRQPALSDDGRVVAFASDSTHLVANDDNGHRDVYVRDYSAGTVVLASAAADGTRGDGPSSQPALSGDGAVVAFHSTATNLVAGASGGNLFVRVLATGQVERVNGAAPGQALGPSAVSFDGRWVAYSTIETVRLYDRVEGTTVLASPTRDGTAPNETCNLCEAFPLSISDDGRYVAFNARATNHAPGQSNNVRDVLVFDRDSGTVELISRGDGANGTEATADSVAPSISGDGRYVAWYAFGPGGLVPGAPLDTTIFLRDRIASTTTAVGVAPPLNNFFGTEPRPTVSRDGRSVVFVSGSARVVEGDTNALPDLYVWSREDGTTTRANLSAARSQADGSGYAYDFNLQGHPRFFAIALSRDGGTVAFSSAATNLGVGDANGADDVFVVQRDSQAVAAASQAVPPPTQRDLTAPVPSLDGSFALMVGTDRAAAFGGAPVGPARGDADAKGIGNKWSSILAFDFDTGEESQIDVATGGAPANDDSYHPSLSADEPIAAFTSDATNLGAALDGNGRPDVFVRDLAAGVTVSLTAGADGDSGRSATSSIGGKWTTAFESNAGNLPGAASANGVRDVFVATEGASEHAFTLRPVSVGLGGAPANGASGDPALTRSGRFAAFSSLATNLVASDANAASDVFVRDLATNTTIQVSATGGGGAPNGASGEPSIVDLTGGKWAAAYESDASDIVTGDANNDTDVFVRTSDGAIELVSRGLGGAPANGKSGKPSLSPDGRHVAFVSTANNLVAGDTNNAPDVFLYDRVTQVTTRVSARPAAQANGHSLAPAVAMRAGSVPVVLFDTAADNLVAGDEDDALDVYRYDAEDQSLLGTDVLIFRNGFE